VRALAGVGKALARIRCFQEVAAGLAESSRA
jgi:hypothetical protein